MNLIEEFGKDLKDLFVITFSFYFILCSNSLMTFQITNQITKKEKVKKEFNDLHINS